MSSGKLPEYTLLTPLPLTPDVVAHDLETLASLGLLPHDPRAYPFLPLPASPPPGPPSPDPDDPDYEEEPPIRRRRGSEDRHPPGEEDSDSSGGRDPFSPACKIPLPTPFSPYEYWLEPSFIRRRNERERQRVRNVNDGFERLKARLPIVGKERDKRLSKVEILRMAIRYIQSLQELLGQSEAKENVRCPEEE